MRKWLFSRMGSNNAGATRFSILGRSPSSSSRILRPRKVSSKPFGESNQKIILKHCACALEGAAHSRLAEEQAGCGCRNAFSSAIAANVMRRFKSTWRSFSIRMAILTIMHGPHAIVPSSSRCVRQRQKKRIGPFGRCIRGGLTPSVSQKCVASLGARVDEGGMIV
jgi:hypothetical protein